MKKLLKVLFKSYLYSTSLYFTALFIYALNETIKEQKNFTQEEDYNNSTDNIVDFLK